MPLPQLARILTLTLTALASLGTMACGPSASQPRSPAQNEQAPAESAPEAAEATAEAEPPAAPEVVVLPPPEELPADPRAAFALLDESLRERFDFATGHLRYAGSALEVMALFSESSQIAQQWDAALGRVVDTTDSPELSALATVRRGSLYDSLWESLATLEEPRIRFLSEEQEEMLQAAEESDRADLKEKAAEVRAQVKAAWDQKRAVELEAIERVVVGRYGAAIATARAHQLSGPDLDRAWQRLAEIEKAVGPEKMADYASLVPALGYSAGMFERREGKN